MLYPRLLLIINVLLSGIFADSKLWAEPIVVSKLGEYVKLDQVADLFVDTSGQMGVRELSSQVFEPYDGNPRKFGYSSSVFWFRFQLTDIPDKGLSLVVLPTFAGLDFLTFYIPKPDGTFEAIETGRLIPMSQHKIRGRLHAIPLELKPDMESGYFYIRFQSEGSLQLETKIMHLEQYAQMVSESQILAGIYLGAMFIMIAYNTIMFAMTRSRRYGYYILYLIASVLLVSALNGNNFVYLWPENPEWNKRFLPIGLNLAIMSASLFFSETLPIPDSMVKTKKFQGVFKILNYLSLLVSIFAPWSIAIRVSQVTMAFGIITFTFLFAYLAIIQRNRTAMFFCVSFVFVAAAVMFPMAMLAGFFESSLTGEAVGSLGSAIQDALLTFALADQYNQIEIDSRHAQQKIVKIQSEYIQQLDYKVLEKTRDIRSLLDSLEQGIFTVSGSPLSINQDYSAHLRTLFKTDEIFGKDPFDLIFSKSQIEAETLAQVRNVIEASLGEDQLMFEMNSGLLIHEFEREDNGEQRIFQIDWTPVLDDNEILVKVLIAVRETTKVKKLQAEAQEKLRELEIVKEIVQVSSTKRHHFFEKIRKSIRGSQDLLGSDTGADSQVRISILIHTLKGDARSLGLKMISQKIHEVEDSFVRSINDEVRPQQQQEKLQTIVDLVEEYLKIEAEKLSQVVSDDEHLSADELQSLVSTIEDIPENHINPISIRAFLHLKRKLFSLLGLATLEDVFTNLAPSMNSIAKQLGKSPPKFVIESDHDAFLQIQFQDVLRDIFLHILRNSMDHGIESDAERQAAGKPEQGMITVKSYSSGDRRVIEYYDDGRGLQLAKIRAKALQLGLIQASHQPSVAETAAFIFAPAFSTAESLSEISGRGVGMAAVRQFVEESGGTLEMKLMPSLVHDSVKFKLLISYPASAFLATPHSSVFNDVS